MRILFSLSFACAALFPSANARAQEVATDGSPHGMIAVGAGAVPDYDGAKDMRPVPFVLGDVRWGGINLEFRGLRVRADLASDPRLSVGPMIGMRLPRRNVDGPVGLLPEIDTAIEAGGFIGYRIGGDKTGQGAVQLDLSVAQDISRTHNGLLVTAGASYAVIRKAKFAFSLDAQTSWANSDYSRTYFGVDEAAAIASGLAAYRPGSGFRDVGAGMTAGYWFNRRIGLMARAGATYLVGDIADSPVTKEGSRWQPAAGLAISYRF